LLYVEIEGGDFGTLSTRSVVTNNQGRATFTYTAPAGTGIDATQNVAILVRPSGTDNAAELPRRVNIRLNPSGTIPTGAPMPSFTFVPEEPEAFIPVRFDGRASTASRGASITNYSWDFGDGTSGTGATTSHSYSAPGSYGVRLTVTDSQGLSATSAAQVITVEAGSTPTATYVFSPTEPVAGKPVFFNGTLSTPGAGHSLVRYRWNWGDGTSNGSGSTVSHTFAAAGSYIVVLTVTDEVGQTATQSQTVDVQ
jgi:PKD repeat protein